MKLSRILKKRKSEARRKHRQHLVTAVERTLISLVIYIHFFSVIIPGMFKTYKEVSLLETKNPLSKSLPEVTGKYESKVYYRFDYPNYA